MATKTLFFNGKVKYCRPYTTNDWGKYATIFYPDATDLEKMKALQTKNVFSRDDDGEYVRLNCQRVKSWRGQDKVYGVDVVDSEGRPFVDPIGNGSDVTVRIEYYDHAIPSSPGKRGHAIRWSGVRINNLVPYEVKTDMLPKELEAVEDLINQPKPF